MVKQTHKVTKRTRIYLISYNKDISIFQCFSQGKKTEIKNSGKTTWLQHSGFLDFLFHQRYKCLDSLTSREGKTENRNISSQMKMLIIFSDQTFYTYYVILQDLLMSLKHEWITVKNLTLSLLGNLGQKGGTQLTQAQMKKWIWYS